MKRMLTVIVLLALVLIVAACKANNGSNVTSTASQTSAVSTQEATANTQPISTTATASVTSAQTTAPTTVDIAFYKSIATKSLSRSLDIGTKTVDYYLNKTLYNNASNVLLGQNLKTKGTYSTVGNASVWHYTSFYAMTSRLAALSLKDSDEKAYFTKLNNDTYNSFGYYRGTADVITYSKTMPMTLYGVNRGKFDNANVSGDQAVYDDQMWIIRECIYSYQKTGEQKYLDEAIRLTDLCLAGWDTTLDKNGNEYGGITWGPSYTSKHTCSNGPIIKPLVEIYEILKEQGNDKAQYYLDWAIKVFDFTYKNLKKSDFTYGDLLGSSRSMVTDNDGTKHYVTTSQGSSDNAKYSYNTGSVISGAAALYRATSDKDYYRKAKNACDGAYRKFCRKYATDGTCIWLAKAESDKELDSTIWFNLVLLQGFIDMEPYYNKCEDYILLFLDSLDYAYENHYKDGLLPRDFVNGWNSLTTRDREKDIMDQASASQMYAMISEWALGVIERNENTVK